MASEVTQRQRAEALILRQMLGKCIAELRVHVFCGDTYPENGWPSVNKVLAEYKQMRHQLDRLAREGVR